MNDPVAASLARAKRTLDAARLLHRGGFEAEAISRSYFAAFHAAEAALLGLGESRSKHSGVVSAFSQLVVRPGSIDAEVGRLLRSLFVRRNRADYGSPDAPLEQADAAMADAARFIGSVEAWLAKRERSSP